MAEGGKNFSQNQRQVLYIARSLLMDEATANIDNSSADTKIHYNFSDVTVLTIVHRLNTNVDSDRILLLDNEK